MLLFMAFLSNKHGVVELSNFQLSVNADPNFITCNLSLFGLNMLINLGKSK